MRHDEKPKPGNLPDDVMERARSRLSSAYGRQLGMLLEEIRGKVVARTSAGRSGYCLKFEDGSWIVCHLSNFVLKWRTGAGVLTSEERALMDDPNTGDGRLPLSADGPYSEEICDMDAEVAQCIGQPVSAIAVGETSFNICFPDGHEIDANVRRDSDGRAILRVFWEQW